MMPGTELILPQGGRNCQFFNPWVLLAAVAERKKVASRHRFLSEINLIGVGSLFGLG